MRILQNFLCRLKNLTLHDEQGAANGQTIRIQNLVHSCITPLQSWEDQLPVTVLHAPLAALSITPLPLDGFHLLLGCLENHSGRLRGVEAEGEVLSN